MDIEDLPQLQCDVDEIDDQIVGLLKKRFRYSTVIGDLKLKAGDPPYNPRRVEAQVERFVSTSIEEGLEPVMARQLISILIAQVLVDRMKAVAADTTSAGASPR